MKTITKEQLDEAKKALDQIGTQIGNICVDIFGFIEICNILGAVEKEINNENKNNGNSRRV